MLWQGLNGRQVMCRIRQSWSRCGPNHPSITVVVWGPLSLVRWSDKLCALCKTPFLPLWLAPGFIQPSPSPSLRLLRKSSLVLWGALFQWSRLPEWGTPWIILICSKHANYTSILMAQNSPNNVLYIKISHFLSLSNIQFSPTRGNVVGSVLYIIPKTRFVYIHILDTHRQTHTPAVCE